MYCVKKLFNNAKTWNPNLCNISNKNPICLQYTPGTSWNIELET